MRAMLYKELHGCIVVDRQVFPVPACGFTNGTRESLRTVCVCSINSAAMITLLLVVLSQS